MDWWLWPQFMSKEITYAHNQTAEIMRREPEFDQVRQYLDDFFEQWHTSNCFNEMNCNFGMFIAVYAFFSCVSVLSCASMHCMPRGCMSLAFIYGSVFNIYHSYVCRGRFLKPDSLVMWGAQFGVVTGVTTWGCLCYICEYGKPAPQRIANVMVP